ncbi:hypothetical protein GWI33_021733 [Rhynchophorus ferrugineus]|uniref:Gustatory receptor n=1 Tax=Rhynchophorus ferrugineus TaxID=354439 RepID=A0A834IP28_RHYFE|nr:hypothetical protein GWI33_021733 [Rhynchophorus ferrugineus]
MIELLKVYGKIKDSVEIINSSASNGVLLLILSCLLHLVVTPYFLLLEIFKGKFSFFGTLQVLWVLGHIGRLLILVEPCQNCLDEYKITSSLISEMALLEFDKETKKLLKHFASQFFYAEISFHACGFFAINRNLLTSVCGAVTTYLVILFQFNGNGGN